MDYGSLIAKRQARFDEIEMAMSQPDFFSDQERSTALTREHQSTKKVLALWEEFEKITADLEDNRELAKGTDELAEMAAEEIPQLETDCERLGSEVQYALLPRDPSEERNALVEIRAGAGGDEASLFAGELLRLYQNHASSQGWKTQHLDSSPSDVGGFKEVVIKVTGEEVFRYLKYESGVHRVQRVPATETQGRIHTSTCTVAVMPEAQEVDVVLKPEELHIQATRSGGSGGQHVNTTDSAVQITHLPTGLQVKCQDGRSQTQIKALGLEILRSKLYEIKVQEEAEKHASHRRSLIGSGDRSEKIRTYNFPQSRVTDHRVNHTSHNLEGIMQGQINELTNVLQKAEMEEKLAQAEKENEGA